MGGTNINMLDNNKLEEILGPSQNIVPRLSNVYKSIRNSLRKKKKKADKDSDEVDMNPSDLTSVSGYGSLGTSSTLSSPAKRVSFVLSSDEDMDHMDVENNKRPPISDPIIDEAGETDNYVCIRRGTQARLQAVSPTADELNDSGVFTDSHLDDIAEEESTYDVVASAPTFLPLRPLFHEVPTSPNLSSVSRTVVTRQSVMEAIENRLEAGRGVMLVGGSGSGKTYAALDLVQNSCFGGNSHVGRTDSNLGSHVVGYHFIQKHNPETLNVPKFVHSLAAQMAQHPYMKAFHDHLIAPENAALLQGLQGEQLVANPEKAFREGVLLPLRKLYAMGKINVMGVIVVDGLEEGGLGENSICSFIAKHLAEMPRFLKLVVTVGRHVSHQDAVRTLNLVPVILDSSAFDDNNNNNADDGMDVHTDMETDLQEYIENRIFNTPTIQANIHTPVGTRRNAQLAKLVAFLAQKALTAGSIHPEDSRLANYLYPQMILDLLEAGVLVVKSDSFRGVPQNLAEALTLFMNKQFVSAHLFHQNSPAAKIISVCLAAPAPLSLIQVFNILTAGDEETSGQCGEPSRPLHNPADNTNFLSAYNKISQLLVTRGDKTLMFRHQLVRDWFNEQSTIAGRFACSPSLGHTMFVKHWARIISRQTVPTSAVASPTWLLDLAHHLVRSNMFDQPADSSQDEALATPPVTTQQRQWLYLNYLMAKATSMGWSLPKTRQDMNIMLQTAFSAGLYSRDKAVCELLNLVIGSH